MWSKQNIRQYNRHFSDCRKRFDVTLAFWLRGQNTLPRGYFKEERSIIQSNIPCDGLQKEVFKKPFSEYNSI